MVLAVGTRLFAGFTQWGIDRELACPGRLRSRGAGAFAHPASALTGDPKPMLRCLLQSLEFFIAVPRAASRWRSGRPRCAVARPSSDPQAEFLAVVRAELPEAAVRRRGHADQALRLAPLSRLQAANFCSRRLCQDNLGWGFATALGASARAATCPSFPSRGWRLSLYFEQLATAMRHQHALTVPSCSTTALSAMCGASRRSSTAPG